MSEIDDISAPLTVQPAQVRSLDGFSSPVSTAQQKAVVNANAIPDEAGRALKIEKQTGIPASIVQTDLPGYDAHAKTQAAIKAIDNPAIANYIDKHSMASQVSNDDYEKLDEVSQYFANLHRDQIHGKASIGVLAGIPEVANLLTTAPGREKLYNALTELPHAIGEGILQFLKTPSDVSSGKINLQTPEGLSQGIGFGLGIALGGRDIRVGRPAINIKTTSSAGIEDFLAKVRGAKTRQEIDDFIASRTEGPPGQMLQIEKANTAGEALDKAVEVSQDSTTKQRSPDLYEQFLEQHGDVGTVHVPAQAILDLYVKEGKVPMVGDGLFGFVSGLAAKATLAVETGAEIKIPLSKYVAHVDEAVHEGLKDVIRVQEKGVTREEAKTIKEEQAKIEAYHGTPHDFESFDLTKIGTGERAQVYGHGLYFAENKAVGQDYAKKLGGSDTPERVAMQYMVTGKQDRVRAIQALENDLKTFRTDPEELAVWGQSLITVEKGLELLKSGKQIVDSEKGQLYKVHINADPTHFLDWDKPLDEQDPHVIDSIDRIPNIEKHKLGDKPTGHDLHEAISEFAFDENGKRVNIGFGKENASKILREAGIPGIKYLDQGSRLHEVDKIKGTIDRTQQSIQEQKALIDAGNSLESRARVVESLEKELEQAKTDLKIAKNPTRNFVVFDDKLVKIIEKNDNPIVQAVEAATEAAKVSLGLRPLENYLTPLFKDGSAINITAAEFKQYADLIDRAQEQVLTKAVALRDREAAKRLTPEWKANEIRTRAEVEKELFASPAFAADRFFNTDKGMLPNGKRILSDFWHPLGEVMSDEWAPIFGFESGSAMVKAILELETERADLGKGPKFQFKQRVDRETAARMESQYGNLADNIALEASDAALAEYNVDLLAAEWKMLAKLNGREPPLSRAELGTWAKDQFEKSTAADVSYEQWRRASEKGGREAEKALLKKDYIEAFNAKQRQMLSFLLAREAKGFEKEQAKIQKKIDRFTDEQVIKSIDQEHLEQIRGVLDSVGVDQRYGPSQALEPIDQFIANSEGQIAIAPWLRGELPEGMRRVPTVDTMTVEQFRDLGKSLQSMEHVGKFAKTLSNAHGAAELQNVIFDAKAELDRFNFINQPMNPSLGQRATSLARKITGAHLLVERMFDYTDRFDPHGPITSYLDRPLRDANAKELVLTEQVTKMLRDLRQHTDASVNDQIENKLIPDQNDKTGFANMRRTNLRQLMLNTGNWSNLKKVTEGFGINEADLRRFIDQNATAKDVAWVNGVWDIFAHLKPEADAMHLRDTGVPIDTISAVSWTVAAGELKGGYYPVVYDRYNSDIQGHIAAKNPIFDPHYVQATTPHRYTEARTEYKGALDLTGGFLASRIQGMVHDIAFREAVRNANKLISNQEFRTAVAQKWGKEYSDLLPSWLKDIANSHTLDDDYAQGLTRAMALVRQNVISTLIAYNPGTFIKHGFTALLMSMDRVGGFKFMEAAREIGTGGMAATAKDLLARNKTVPDEAFMDDFRTMLDQGERGENARQFVLDSSPVMRNRQRQADDSIRGAIDRMNSYGWGQSFSNFRDRSMLLGRFMVAFSDGVSSYPTWLAAYKKAYLAGEEHADAVFIADKEVSRAHGSSFVGDQPLVTRIKNGPTGEIARWFVPLYKFWNHTVNNNFQLAWDSAAALRGPPDGAAPEPGANAWSISKRVGLIMATIFIEEMASAAKDEDHHGILTKMALASLRYFGAGFVGARELTNGLAAGYEPSTGLLGTLGRGISDTVKDLKKASGIKAGVAKNWIIHTATTLGYATGIGGTQLGKTGSYLNDLRTGVERSPQTFNDLRQGLRTGHSKARVH